MISEQGRRAVALINGIALGPAAGAGPRDPELWRALLMAFVIDADQRGHQDTVSYAADALAGIWHDQDDSGTPSLTESVSSRFPGLPDLTAGMRRSACEALFAASREAAGLGAADTLNLFWMLEEIITEAGFGDTVAEIGQAFYQLVVKERDYARVQAMNRQLRLDEQAKRLKAAEEERDALRERLTALETAP